ncbi:MAG: thioesterase family protein, partial [Pseudomonadota bacterium]
NGHMNESRYGQVFSDAADAVLAHIGVDADYVAAGNSYFTAETNVKYILETHAGEMISCETRVLIGEGKKLKLFHEMRRDSDGELLASCEQFLLHVSLETRKSCAPRPEVLARLESLARAHAEN